MTEEIWGTGSTIVGLQSRTLLGWKKMETAVLVFLHLNRGSAGRMFSRLSRVAVKQATIIVPFSITSWI
jgi:hypothetical protein